MRLAIFFLVCLGLASAVPMYSSDVDDIDELMLQADGGFGEKLKELFEDIVDRIKKAVDEGKGVREDLFKKAEKIFDRLKELGVEVSEKIKEKFEELRNKFNKNGPTFENADISNIFEMFKKLKKLIKEKLDPEELKEKVEKIFGKGSELAEQIINMLKEKGEKGKNKILDWIDRVLPDKEERSASDVSDKLKEFFRDLKIDLKGKFSKFAEWVKEKYEKGLEKGKSKVENLKKIAKEFIDDTKHISKETAREALDFFNDYKDDVGTLYKYVVEKVKEILKS